MCHLSNAFGKYKVKVLATPMHVNAYQQQQQQQQQQPKQKAKHTLLSIGNINSIMDTIDGKLSPKDTDMFEEFASFPADVFMNRFSS
jgi:hypothetical protein